MYSDVQYMCSYKELGRLLEVGERGLDAVLVEEHVDGRVERVAELVDCRAHLLHEVAPHADQVGHRRAAHAYTNNGSHCCILYRLTIEGRQRHRKKEREREKE